MTLAHHGCFLEGELDASSGCLEGPLSVIIEVVEFQAAECGVQGKFKCSSGADELGWACTLEVGQRAVWQYCRDRFASLDANVVLSNAAGSGKKQNVTGQ